MMWFGGSVWSDVGPPRSLFLGPKISRITPGPGQSLQADSLLRCAVTVSKTKDRCPNDAVMLG